MDALLDEVESLEAILMDDVKITRNSETGIPEMIETIVLPTVGDEIESQYVCITLQVKFTKGYPDVKPSYTLRNPRGLDDSGIETIRNAIESKLNESLGSPVVFDLIDVIREHLTHSNLPSGQCVVCLYGFQDNDAFTKTECYHYLHSYCLARHLDASKKNYDEDIAKLPAWQQINAKPYQACCPVCREPISKDAEPLRCANQPIELQNAPNFEVTSDLKSLQQRMANLYMHQKSRGGIIDVNVDEMNVISIQSEEAEQRQTRKSSKQNPQKPQNDIQANQARQAAALALRNATMIKNDDDDDDDDDDENVRRRHGRRGGHRHKRHENFGKRHSKMSNTSHMNNTETDEAGAGGGGGSNKR